MALADRVDIVALIDEAREVRDAHLEALVTGIDHGMVSLNEHERRPATAVVALCAPALIRSTSLANLRRWREQGARVRACDAWNQLMTTAQDSERFAAMLGRDQRATELRLSPPNVGLPPADVIERLNRVRAPARPDWLLAILTFGEGSLKRL